MVSSTVIECRARGHSIAMIAHPSSPNRAEPGANGRQEPASLPGYLRILEVRNEFTRTCGRDLVQVLDQDCCWTAGDSAVEKTVKLTGNARSRDMASSSNHACELKPT